MNEIEKKKEYWKQKKAAAERKIAALMAAQKKEDDRKKAVLGNVVHGLLTSGREVTIDTIFEELSKIKRQPDKRLAAGLIEELIQKEEER